MESGEEEVKGGIQKRMNIKQHISKVKERISLLSKEMKPLQDKIKLEGLLLTALYSTCSHNYQIVKGSKKVGTMQCEICGESHEFFTVDPVYAASMGKCIPAIKSDLREWKEKLEFLNRMARQTMSISDLSIINDYITNQISKCEEQLKELT